MLLKIKRDTAEDAFPLAADIIADIVSMLYALNAGTANRLLIALRNISCVLHRPNSEYFMPSPQMYMNMIAK